MKRQLKRVIIFVLVVTIVSSICGCNRLKNAVGAFLEDPEASESVDVEEPGSDLDDNNLIGEPDTEEEPAGVVGNLNDPNAIDVGIGGTSQTTENIGNASDANTTNDDTIVLNPIAEEYIEFLLPEGWIYTTYADQDTDIMLYVYDPKNPDMGYYYLYGIGPFMKDTAAAGFYTDPMFTTAVTLTEPTLDQLYYNWNEFLSYANSRGVMNGYPVMNNVAIVSKEPCSSPLASIALDEAVLTVTYQNAQGNPCKGQFSGTLYSILDQYVGNVNCGFYGVYNACGIMAPEGEFDLYLEMLKTCLSSVNLTQAYVDYHNSNSARSSGETSDSALQGEITNSITGAVYENYSE